MDGDSGQRLRAYPGVEVYDIAFARKGPLQAVDEQGNHLVNLGYGVLELVLRFTVRDMNNWRLPGSVVVHDGRHTLVVRAMVDRRV